MSAHCPACGGALRDGACARCFFAEAFAADEPAPGGETPEPIESYEFISEIARGGMGVVWRARQRKLGREVAVKLLRDDALPGEDAARRFRLEGEAVAQLRHPHIVAVYEIGETGGRPFLSMELLGGGSLADRLKTKPLAARDAVELLAKIARAVHFAHERGVLHRDLKPANILFDDAGEPRVTDFGLARLLEQETGLTVSGAALGTPAYMPPEQAAGRNHEVTTASDVYGLGAVLYEMLTGQAPFRGGSQLEILRRVAEEEPQRPSTVVAHLDRDLETICLKCLEKSPTARYPGALALAEDLERWRAGEPIRARHVTTPERLWKWARRRPALAALWVVLTLVCVGIAAGGTLYAIRLKRERTTALHHLARQHSQAALTLLESGEWHRALLSLVEAIQIGTGEPGRDRINRLRFECIVRQSPRLAMWWAEVPRHAEFTADGAALLFLHDRHAQLCDATSGAPLGPALPHETTLTAAAANADGTRVVCGTDDGQWTLWDPRAGRIVARGEGRLHGPPPPGVSRPTAVFGGDRFVAVQGDKAQCFLAVDGEPAGAPIQRRAPIRWAVLPPDGASVLSFSEENLLRPSADRPDGTGPQYLCQPSTELALFASGLGIEAFQADDGWCGIVRWPDQAPIRDNRLRQSVLAQTFRRSLNWVFLARSPRGVYLVDGWSPVAPPLFDHGAAGVAGAFDSPGLTALTLASDGSAQHWDLLGDRSLGPRLRVIGAPLGVVLSGEGKSALLRSDAATWLWRQREPTIADATAGVSPTPHSAGGRVAVRIGPDATALLCDAQTGAVLFAPLRHSAQVESAGFSPDGALLATRAADVVRVWEAASGRPVTPPIVHPGLAELRWSADSTTLFTKGGGDSWRSLDLTAGARPIAEMKSLAHLLAAGRLVAGGEGGFLALDPADFRTAWEEAAAAQPR